MNVQDFYYDLPENQIAQHPTQCRDQSRLLIYHRKTRCIQHKNFSDIIDYLQPGDALVLNETKVIPARLIGKRMDTGGNMEFLLLHSLGDDVWEALSKPARRASVGKLFTFGDNQLTATVIEELSEGRRKIKLDYDGDLSRILECVGSIPLPPYIHENLDDPDRYQTIYARKAGSAAAPTAGLHFTDTLLDKIRDKNISIVKLLLHVGLGTFRPVKVDNIHEHKMHEEFYQVSSTAANTLNHIRETGGRIICVGTTSARTLETVTTDTGLIQPGSGWTDIFIYPGYQFKAVDALITNFHLPYSTLLMMISALCSREEILSIYKTAVESNYRFFSFGDAMLID